jgi:hypothetical protein
MIRALILLALMTHVRIANADACAETPFAEFGGDEVRVYVGHEPATVWLHWRYASRDAFADIEMSSEGSCRYRANIDLVERAVATVEYWIEALGPDGTLVARSGSAEEPLVHTLVPHESCDEPCCAANLCWPMPEPTGIDIPPPARRDLLFRLAVGLSDGAAPIADVEVSHFVRSTTSVGFAARWHGNVVPLLRARQFLRGRNGVAIDLSVGGAPSLVVGGGLGYFMALGSQTSWSVEVDALYPIGGSARLGIELRR